MLWLIWCSLILIHCTIGFRDSASPALRYSRLWARQFNSGTYSTFADIETRQGREVKKFQERLGITEDMYKMDTIKNVKNGKDLKKEANKNRRNAEKPPKVKLPPIESTFNSTRNLTEIAIIVECLNGAYNGMYRHWIRTTENERMGFFEWEKFYNLIGDRIARIGEDRKRKKMYSWIKYALNKKHIGMTKEGVWAWLYVPYRKSKTKTKRDEVRAYMRKKKKRVYTGFLTIKD